MASFRQLWIMLTSRLTILKKKKRRALLVNIILFGPIKRLAHIIIALDRTHTIYVVFQSRGFYDVPRVLIGDAKSFQALAATLDYVILLASTSLWYQSDARQDEFRLSS